MNPTLEELVRQATLTLRRVSALIDVLADLAAALTYSIDKKTGREPGRVR